MLGYYPNSNAKLKGSNLKAKVQTLVLWTFRKHLPGLIYIDSTIHTNIHNRQHTTIIHTHTHTHTHTHKHTYLQRIIHLLAHPYIHTCIIL